MASIESAQKSMRAASAVYSLAPVAQLVNTLRRKLCTQEATLASAAHQNKQQQQQVSPPSLATAHSPSMLALNGQSQPRERQREFELEARLGRVVREPGGHTRFAAGVSPAFFVAAFNVACHLDDWLPTAESTRTDPNHTGTPSLVRGVFSAPSSPLVAGVVGTGRHPDAITAEESHACTWRWVGLPDPVRTTVYYTCEAVAAGTAIVEHTVKAKMGTCDLACSRHDAGSGNDAGAAATCTDSVARLPKDERVWDVRMALASETPLLLPHSAPHAVQTERMAIRQRQRFLLCEESRSPLWAVDFTLVWAGRTRTEAELAQGSSPPEFHIEWEYVGGRQGLVGRSDAQLAEALVDHIHEMLSLASYWSDLEDQAETCPALALSPTIARKERDPAGRRLHPKRKAAITREDSSNNDCRQRVDQDVIDSGKRADNEHNDRDQERRERGRKQAIKDDFGVGRRDVTATKLSDSREPCADEDDLRRRPKKRSSLAREENPRDSNMHEAKRRKLDDGTNRGLQDDRPNSDHARLARDANANVEDDPLPVPQLAEFDLTLCACTGAARYDWIE